MTPPFHITLCKTEGSNTFSTSAGCILCDFRLRKFLGRHIHRRFFNSFPVCGIVLKQCAAFFGKRLSLKAARSVISNIRKAAPSTEGLAELMLYYVECGVELTNVYGDINEAFYDSIESMFTDYVTLLNSMEHDGCYKKTCSATCKGVP